MEEETHEPTTASPPSKKPKMSTSDSEPESTAAAPSAAEQRRRYKRRKVAILFAYCGYGYQGMQKNPGAKTIEGDFEEALYRAGAVPESDRNAPRRYDWARAARTDKGVSAAAQVVSGRFYVDPPGFVERLNEQLADQIHVFGYKRVTGAFNAKKFCDRRRYIYFLPFFALDPSSHPDREAVMASLGSSTELNKCIECSERGRKIPKELTDEKISDLCENNGQIISNTEERMNRSVFSYEEAEKERFNRILKNYEGTHNFHNFTTRTKAEDPSAKRYIISFNANSMVCLDGIDFVKCEVIGQSFMLHQIRKMVGLAVAIMRSCAPESLMEIAFKKDVRINVPTAPEVGLFLDECFFSSYNKKWNNSHEEVSMKDYEQQAEEFKMKYIYSHIAAMEHKEGAVALWLHSLNRRNYPDFGYLEKNGESCENGVEGLMKEESLVGGEVKEVEKEGMEELKEREEMEESKEVRMEEMEESKEVKNEMKESEEVRKEEMEKLKEVEKEEAEESKEVEKEDMEEVKKVKEGMEEVKKEEMEESRKENLGCEELKEENLGCEESKEANLGQVEKETLKDENLCQ